MDWKTVKIDLLPLLDELKHAIIACDSEYVLILCDKIAKEYVDD